MTDAATIKRANPFWDFSLRIYSSPAVQKACVELQDSSGVDVNVLLYVLWHAHERRVVTNDDARAVLALVDPWRLDVVVPLRTARRALKVPTAGFAGAEAEALRAQVKRAEAEFERLQQSALHALKLPSGPASAAPGADVRALAAGNAAAYAHALARTLAPAPLGVLLDATAALGDGRVA